MLSNFHITVIPFSYASKDIHIDDQHLQLLKFALIYADKVQFFTFKALLNNLFSFLIEEMPKDNKLMKEFNEIKLSFKNSILEKLENSNVKEKCEYKKLEECAKENNIKIDKLIELAINAKLQKFGNLLINAFNELREEIGLNELNPFIDLGILDVYSIGKSTLNEKTTLLSDEAGLIQVNKMISENKIKIPNIYLNKIKYTTLALELFQRLPSFDKVTLDQVVDIRNTLKGPLINFRSAMIKLSENIKSYPWENNFYIEVENLIMKEIEPAILEIEEECKTNSYLRILSKNMFKENSWAIPSGFGFAISKLSELSNISSALIGLSFGMGKAALKAVEEWQNKKTKINMNPFFFYYKIKNLRKKD